MEWAEVSAGQDRCPELRGYRSADEIDLDDLRQQVSRWLGEYPDGTAEQVIDDLAPVYAGCDAGEIAVMLRAALFTEKPGTPAVNGLFRMQTRVLRRPSLPARGRAGAR